MMNNIYLSRHPGEKPVRLQSRPFSTDWFATIRSNHSRLSRLVALLLLTIYSGDDDASDAIEGIFLNLASYLQCSGAWYYSCNDEQWANLDIACQELLKLLDDPQIDRVVSNQLPSTT